MASAPGCTFYNNVGKFTGLISAPTLSTQREMPPDFKMGVSARDLANPPTDFIYTFERSGKATYDVTVRSPRRRHQDGEFEITEDQVVGLWKAVQESRFDELDARYPSSGDGTDKTEGVQTFYVSADGAEWKVESRYVANPTLRKLREAALSVVRKDIQDADGADSARPKEFIADAATHLFHLPDCAQLKDVPAQQRQPFATPFDALNFNFKPCPECRPMKTK